MAVCSLVLALCLLLVVRCMFICLFVSFVVGGCWLLGWWCDVRLLLGLLAVRLLGL